MSLSAGPRGASISVGSRGVYGNVGIPGTGISYRAKIAGGGRGRQRAPADLQAPPTSLSVHLALQDDGTVELQDADGNLLPRSLARMVREQQGEQVQAWLAEHCALWNQNIDGILNLHRDTPAPEDPVRLPAAAYPLPAPVLPPERPLGFLARILPWKRREIEAWNLAQRHSHHEALLAWQDAHRAFGAEQDRRRARLLRAGEGDAEAMQDALGARLESLAWPRETEVSLEVEGRAVWLDIDLPEIEDMPTQEATVAARGLKLNIRERSETRRRREYMAHVHAVCFRAAGEVFYTLKGIDHVVVSGYSQRHARETGRLGDEYLLSACIRRASWREIDFSALETLDPVACFDRFDLRRRMTKTGIFTAVEPFGRGDVSLSGPP